MVLLDTNILIYSVDPAYPQVRRYLRNYRYGVSIITAIEALGYPSITSQEEADLREVIISGNTLELTSDIARQAIHLRQARKMGLGDAIIAATALATGMELVTRNTRDFAGVPGLHIVNPVDDAAERNP